MDSTIKKGFKIKIVAMIIILLLFGAVLPLNINKVYAEDDFSISTILNDVKNFFEKGRTADTGIDTGELQNSFIEKIAPLASALFQIGLAIAVAVSMILGVQYIIASPEKQGELKERLIGFAIGTFVLASAYTIWEITVTILSAATGISV